MCSSQRETSLQSNAVSHRLSVNQESALNYNKCPFKHRSLLNLTHAWLIDYFIRTTRTYSRYGCFDTVRPGQNVLHFAVDLFILIIVNENCCIVVQVSSVKQPITWAKYGPVSYTCVTRPQWVDTNTTQTTCTLRWRHNGRDCVSNHQPHNCLLSCLFRLRSK